MTPETIFEFFAEKIERLRQEAIIDPSKKRSCMDDIRLIHDAKVIVQIAGGVEKAIQITEKGHRSNQATIDAFQRAIDETKSQDRATLEKLETYRNRIKELEKSQSKQEFTLKLFRDALAASLPTVK